MVLNVKKTKEIVFDFRVKKITIKSINLCDLDRDVTRTLIGRGVVFIHIFMFCPTDFF